MKPTKPLLVLGAIAFLLYQSVFVVYQTEQALVLQFGEVKRVIDTPGLKFKIPFVQNVQLFDKRLLVLDIKPKEVNATDEELKINERIVIDAYVVYRITDPLKFYQAVRDEYGLEAQLGSIIQSSLSRTIGSISLRDLLSKQRTQIMATVKSEINRIATGQTDAKEEVSSIKGGFGIEVVDVRIMRADLPPVVSQSTFERMRSDFQKEAQKFRAEGEEKSLKIRSEADRERTELLATASKEAEMIRGQGDGTAAKIYADAFNRDPEFFDFYRSMQAYKHATGEKGETSAVLSPNSEFFKYLGR